MNFHHCLNYSHGLESACIAFSYPWLLECLKASFTFTYQILNMSFKYVYKKNSIIATTSWNVYQFVIGYTNPEVIFQPCLIHIGQYKLWNTSTKKTLLVQARSKQVLGRNRTRWLWFVTTIQISKHTCFVMFFNRESRGDPYTRVVLYFWPVSCFV